MNGRQGALLSRPPLDGEAEAICSAYYYSLVEGDQSQGGATRCGNRARAPRPTRNVLCSSQLLSDTGHEYEWC